jgi:hypothetical protein
MDRPSVAFTRRADAPEFDIDAVRTTELKVIRTSAGGGVELFDVCADPREQHDAAAERAADVAALRAVLDATRSRLQAAAAAPSRAIDAMTRERLRALGYLRDRD